MILYHSLKLFPSWKLVADSSWILCSLEDMLKFIWIKYCIKSCKCSSFRFPFFIFDGVNRAKLSVFLFDHGGSAFHFTHECKLHAIVSFLSLPGIFIFYFKETRTLSAKKKSALQNHYCWLERACQWADWNERQRGAGNKPRYRAWASTVVVCRRTCLALHARLAPRAHPSFAK